MGRWRGVLSLEKKLRRGSIAHYNHLKIGYSQVKIGVFFQAVSRRTKTNGIKAVLREL